MIEVLTDRSRQICFQECPRRRYLNYHFPSEAGEIGLQQTKAVIPLATGTFTHHGLACLLAGIEIEDAVYEATNMYWQEVNQRGLEVEPGEDMPYVAAEQIALVEGMLRAYNARRLPLLLDEYEVIETEVEYLMPLSDGITMMARPDAVLRHKQDNGIYIQSYKTAAGFDSRTQASGEHDIQGLSEAAVWEYNHPGERIAGVRMEYLIKGKRYEYPKGSGKWVQYSPLIRGYVKHDVTHDEFGWTRDWTDEDGKDRKLPWQTWKAFSAWEAEGGIKAWIDLLATGRVQEEAGDCLDRQFITPLPYFRQEDDLRDWYEQTEYQERTIAQRLATLHDGSMIGHSERTFLNQHFPMNRQSCDWPSKCQFQDYCFGTNVRQNPIGSGLYVPRVPHHEPELVQLTVKKAVE